MNWVDMSEDYYMEKGEDIDTFSQLVEFVKVRNE